jgi:hypothetical protein
MIECAQIGREIHIKHRVIFVSGARHGIDPRTLLSNFRLNNPKSMKYFPEEDMMTMIICMCLWSIHISDDRDCEVFKLKGQSSRELARSAQSPGASIPRAWFDG